MRNRRCNLFTAILCLFLSVSLAVRAQVPDGPPQIPQEQIDALQTVFRLEDARAQAEALDRFLATYPDTPLKADVYRAQFTSQRAFVTDHDLLWATGERYIKEVTMLVDTRMAPYIRNPALAQVYNEVAYEFAERSQHLDGALAYAQQALSCVIESANTPPPNTPADQWTGQLKDLHGQILDTVAWVQFRRKAHTDADKAVQDALTMLPDHASILYHAGMIHAASGREEKAIDAWLSALSVDYPDSAARPELDRVFKKKYGGAAKMQLDTQLAAAQRSAEARKIQMLVSQRLNIKARDFAMTALSGDVVSLSDLQGKVVVVNFWATWCGPCRQEMPALERVWQSYRNIPGVTFLIASVDEEMNLVKPYIAENRYTFPVYYAGTAAQTYQVVSIPTTYIIDRAGVVQFVHVGYRPDIEKVLGWQIDALKGE